MSDTEQRLARMEARIRELEDRLAIYQIFATYGPGVDSLAGDRVGELWTETGTYETEHDVFAGAAAIGAITRDPMHLAYVERGCAHVMSLPRIVLDGDHAVATGYSRVYVHRNGEWYVDRASANRWELVRVNQTWKVTRRVNKLLRGTPESRALLGRDLDRTEAALEQSAGT